DFRAHLVEARVDVVGPGGGRGRQRGGQREEPGRAGEAEWGSRHGRLLRVCEGGTGGFTTKAQRAQRRREELFGSCSLCDLCAFVVNHHFPHGLWNTATS